MKKLILYIASILTLGLSACHEDYNEGVFPQTNPEEEPQIFEGFEFELGEDFVGDALNLNDFKATDNLDVIVATKTPELAENATMEYVMEVSNTEDFANLVKVEVGSGSELGVDPINSAYRELMGISPTAKPLYYRFLAYIAEGTAKVRVGEYHLSGTKLLTPIPLDLPVLSKEYYVMGTMTDWNQTDASTLLKFEHSGNDPYDDPVFTIRIKAGANDEFKVVPKSAVDAVNAGSATEFEENAMGTDVAEPVMEGKLIIGQDVQRIMLGEEGYYDITINVLNQTYSLNFLGLGVPLPENMYIIGSPFNWSWDEAATMVPVNGMPGLFWSIKHFDEGDELKFNYEKAWNGTEFGVSKVCAEGADFAQVTGGDNIIIGKEGWYLVMVTASYADETQTSFDFSVDFREPQVYIIGDGATEGWTAGEATSLFTIEGDEFVSPAFANDGNLRMFVSIAENGGDWWRAEFNIFDGVIGYRGNGGDQAPVEITAGGKAYLNFMTEAGIIK